MAEVALMIAGRSYTVACRDGDEPNLKRLEGLIGKHAEMAQRASGGINSERTLLYIALILADLLDEAERNPPQGVSPVLLDNIADRLEALAVALEDDTAAA